MKKIETWKPIVNYKGLYEISDFGRVRSLERDSKYRKNIVRTYHKNERFLKFGLARGYRNVKLYDGNAKGVTITIHRLVAIHFISNPHNLSKINHIDGNKLNNNSWNLEWVTHSYNVKHAYDTGLKNPLNYKGEGNKSSILTEKKVIEIRKERELNKVSYSTLSKRFNTSLSNIYSIVKRQSWTHV